MSSANKIQTMEDLDNEVDDEDEAEERIRVLRQESLDGPEDQLSGNEGEVPTFDDLVVDDELDDLDRIVKYSKSNISLQRLVHVRMIEQISKKSSINGIMNKIIPLIQDLVLDKEFVIRQHLAKQLPPLAMACYYGRKKDGKGQESIQEDSYQSILQVILPSLQTLLSDPEKAEVRLTAVEAMVDLIEFVKLNDVMEHVLSSVIILAHDSENKDLRVTAVHLIQKLCPKLGADLCQQFILPEIISLADDNVFQVRRAASLSIPFIIKFCGDFPRLISCFSRLCIDSIFSVRKACAESLPNVCLAIQKDEKAFHAAVKTLWPAYLGFFKDENPHVQEGAYCSISFMLGVIKQDGDDSAKVKTLLQLFLNLSKDVKFERRGKSSRYYCAYNFPAVVFYLGPKKWPGALHLAYQTLCKEEDVNVQRSLASSLHEIAAIIGPKHAATDLNPVYHSLISSSPYQDVQLKCLENTALFLKELPEHDRDMHAAKILSYLDTLGSKNWRARADIAKQMSYFVNAFSFEPTHQFMFPLLYKLLSDPVSQVSIASIDCIGPLLLRLFKSKTHALWITEIMEKCKAYAKSQSHHERFLFILICAHLITFSEVSESIRSRTLSDLIPLLISLANDKTSNVKIRLAKALVGFPPKVKSLPEIAALITNFKNSTNREIAMASGLTEEEFCMKNQVVLKVISVDMQREFSKASATDAHRVLSQPDAFAGGGGSNTDIDDIQKNIDMAARAVAALEIRKGS